MFNLLSLTYLTQQDYFNFRSFSCKWYDFIISSFSMTNIPYI
jgi:hypothetical protein